MNLPVQVIEAIQKRKCLLVVGRRATLEAVKGQGGVFPGEKRLAQLMTGRKVSLQEAMAEVEAKSGKEGLLENLREQLSAEGTEPGAFHQKVVQHFDLVFSTCWDPLLAQAATAAKRPVKVLQRGEALPQPDPEQFTLYNLWGDFENKAHFAATPQHRREVLLPEGTRHYLRRLLRGHVLLFVGFRPDEQEFQDLFDELVEGFGGELPRTHWAVCQGRITDLQWQKWVWRGMLLFTADPEELMEAVEQVDA
jgi:hypothetical protein